MKNLLILLIVALTYSCSGGKAVDKVVIQPRDTVKDVQYEFTNPEDTIKFSIDTKVPDSTLVAYYQYLKDSTSRAEGIKDSMQLVNFKKITKIINGGYNGLDDRIKRWEHIKKTMKTIEEKQ